MFPSAIEGVQAYFYLLGEEFQDLKRLCPNFESAFDWSNDDFEYLEARAGESALLLVKAFDAEHCDALRVLVALTETFGLVENHDSIKARVSTSSEWLNLEIYGCSLAIAVYLASGIEWDRQQCAMVFLGIDKWCRDGNQDVEALIGQASGVVLLGTSDYHVCFHCGTRKS